MGTLFYKDGDETTLPMSSLPSPNLEVDDDGRPKRTGTKWTASAHIITAVIGSGVLSLAWSMSQLGWVGGFLALLTFAFITYYTSLLLAECYRSPPLAHGSTPPKRNRTYRDAVQSNLGPLQAKLCMVSQYASLFGIAIGYTITASISMVAIKRSNCFHKRGHSSVCFALPYTFMTLFGVVEVVLSQIPNFGKLWWLSIVAATMSFSYSFIGIGLGLRKAIESGHSHGTLGGSIYSHDRFFTHGPNDIWGALQALGNIAFAYSYTGILIEIQDTLKSPPDESEVMKKANLLGMSTTTMFYMLCACIGYAAFGNKSPGNLLTGFGFYEPFWLVDLANVFVVVHLMGAFQVVCQPIYAFVEDWASSSFPKSKVIQKIYSIPIPFSHKVYHVSLFRIVWRTFYVFVVSIIGMILPFFNDVLGLLGATAFWPLSVYFPIQMSIARFNIPRWDRKWVLLQALSMFCLIISIASFVGSVQSVIKDVTTYKPFHGNH